MINLDKRSTPAASPVDSLAPTPDRAPDAHGALSDDTLFPVEIAALYLRMSPSDFADSQKPKRTDGRANPGGPAAAQSGKSAKGQAQPAAFKLSALREMGKVPISSAADDAISKAGLLGWANTKLPFFAELEPRVKRGRRVLIGNAWDMASPHREARFADLLSGRIRFTWVTSSEAAASLWSDPSSHRAFADRGLALLETESRTIEASVTATRNLAQDTAPSTDSADA
jgi:hypothetical protein